MYKCVSQLVLFFTTFVFRDICRQFVDYNLIPLILNSTSAALNEQIICTDLLGVCGGKLRGLEAPHSKLSILGGGEQPLPPGNLVAIDEFSCDQLIANIGSAATTKGDIISLLQFFANFLSKA